MNNLSRILGLDFGLRRVGVAIAEGETVASLDTIESDNREDTMTQILKICREEQVAKIILGLSKNESGEADPSRVGELRRDEAEDMVRSFALELNKNIDIPIEFVDETLTSKEAERILQDLKIDPRSKDYKKEIDRISAKLILEQYLNNYE